MENLRCECGKIVCQVQGNCIIIKCRHCKRFIVIHTNGIITENDGNWKIEFN